MKNTVLSQITRFRDHLLSEEKAPATVQKYASDVAAFFDWLGEQKFDKCAVLGYKAYLCEKYAPASVNAAISSLNSFFGFICRQELKLKSLKTQRRLFSSEEKELTKAEYERLLRAARDRNNQRLYLLMQR